MTPPPPNPPPPPDEPDAALRMPPRYGRRIALLMLPVVLAPVLLAVCLFPLLKPYDAIEEVRADDIASFRVHVLNRKEIDGGAEIDPFFADADDYPALLRRLAGVPEVSGFDGARGPWLGEYRVVTKDGRKLTVRFYWARTAGGGQEPVLRFQVGSRFFEGGTAESLIVVAKTAEGRGRKSR